MKSGAITNSPEVFLLDFRNDMIPAVLPWLNDEKFMRFSRHAGKVHTYETQAEYARSFDWSPSYYWGVHKNKDLELIGTATAIVEDGVADIGLLIGQSGMGYGKATFQAIMNYLFTFTNIRKVTGGTVEENVGFSICCLNSGLSLEGRRPEQIVIDARPQTLMLYGLLKRDWKQFEASR